MFIVRCKLHDYSIFFHNTLYRFLNHIHYHNCVMFNILFATIYRCNIKWYNAPLKVQKLIFFLLQKTTRCYKVDACGIFIPCLEGFATVRDLN